MSKIACAVLLLLLAIPARAAGSQDCPEALNAHPNAVKTRAFVCSASIEELEGYFAKRQGDYEADVIDGGQLLWSYDQLWEPYPFERLQKWLERYPNSYAAHLAMAEALIKRAFVIRSRRVEGFLALSNWVSLYLLKWKIDGYLQRSLKLNYRKPYLTYYYLVRAERSSAVLPWRRDTDDPRPASRGYIERAAQIDGPAFVARAAYMISLEPRWGGNTAAMRRLYEESLNVGLNKAQLGRLESMVLFEESRLKDPDSQRLERLAMAIRANELYEDIRYLRDIIWLKTRAQQWVGALPELNRALEVAPYDRWVLDRRANALFVAERHAEAYRDFLVLANEGNAFAQNKIGYYLSMGIGVKQDKREGAKWFAKAAASGDQHGIANLKRAREEGSI